MPFDPTSDVRIQVWRRILSKRIWQETGPKEKTILITILLMASQENERAIWKGKEKDLKPGSFVATDDEVAHYAGPQIDAADIANALESFEKTYDFLQSKFSDTTPPYRLVKILNWRKYNPDGLSAEESEQRRDDAEKLYRYYLEKIQPDRKSKARAVSNIMKHMRRHKPKDLAIAVANYRRKSSFMPSSFRKDPANFFGVNDHYFKDFLPENFSTNLDLQRQIREDEKAAREIGIPAPVDGMIPQVLTPDRLREINS